MSIIVSPARCGVTVIAIMDEVKLAEIQTKQANNGKKCKLYRNVSQSKKIVLFSFTFISELMSEIPSQAPVISVYPVGPSLGLRNEIFLAVHCCPMYDILMQFSFTGVNVCITLVPCSATKNVEIRTFIRK